MARHAFRRTLASLLCLALAALALPAVAADWPMYRGPDHDGSSKEAGWLKPGGSFKVAWTQEVGTGCSSIVVVDGRCYTMGNAGPKKGAKDTVFCFDAATGKEIWTFSYPCALTPKLYEGGPNATVTVADGKAYTVSKEGHVFCLDAVKGTKVWGIKLEAKAPSWGYGGSVLALGKKLIVNSGPAGTALDAETGKVLWTSGKSTGGYSTPVPYQADGKTAVVLFSAKNVVAVNAEDGKVLWQHPWKTSWDVNAADPIVLDGGKKVFVSSGYGTGCALLDVSGAEPKEIWRNKNMKNKHCCSVVYQGAIFGFDETKLTCLDLATGEKKWSEGSLSRGTVALADGKLILLAERGKVVIAEASADGFKEITSVQAVEGKCWSVPVLANGRIYAKSKRGAFACLTATE